MPAWAPARGGAALDPRASGSLGAEERENGGVGGRGGQGEGPLPAPHSYEPLIQPDRRAVPSSSESPAALAQDLHGVWELLSVPYQQVIRSHYMGQCLALRVSALYRKVLFC